MKIKQHISFNIQNKPQLLFGLVLFALLLASLITFFRYKSINPQTIRSVQQTPSLIERKITELQLDEIARQPSIIQAQKEWETYKDIFYGYSIQYPKGWYLLPMSPSSAGRGGTTRISTYDSTFPDSKMRRAEVAAQGYTDIFIGQFLTPKSQNESVEHWLERKDLMVVQSAEIMERRTIKGSNEPALIEFSTSDTPDSPSGLMIYIPRENQVLFISVSEFPSPSQYHELIDQILATFSLEPTPLSD